jgi:hypothetical protein
MTDAKKPAGRKQARKGDRSIYWDESKKCYFGSISLGLNPDGTRNRPKVSGKTQRDVRAKLKELKEAPSGTAPPGATNGSLFWLPAALHNLPTGARGVLRKTRKRPCYQGL